VADPLAVTLHALGAESASGVGPAVEIGALRTFLAGSTTLTTKTGNGVVGFAIETSLDGSTGWRTVRDVGALPGAGKIQFHVDELERYVRLAWTFDVVTNATFVVTAEAHVLYAKRSDLGLSIQADALEDEQEEKLSRALLSATSDIDDALNVNYPLPLTTWPPSITQRCADIGTWRVMKAIGFQPDGSDEVIRMSFDDATKWLEKVAQRKIIPAGLAPRPIDASRASSGNPSNPTEILPRMSDNWGDFG
jgi:phage gp36-like protein